MKKQNKWKKSCICVLTLAMLFVLVVPSPVLAEGDEPAETPAGAETAANNEEAGAVEEQQEGPEKEPEEEVEITPEVTLSSLPDPVVTAEIEQESEGVSDTVELLSENGTILLDEEGNEVPLGSQEAADVLAAADPVWCPSAGVCGDSHINMADAIADALADGGDGTILVESGTFSGFELSNFGTSGSPVNIVIQGGVGGPTYFDSQIYINSNYANITLRDFTVSISGSDAGIGIEGTAVSSGADTPTLLALDNSGSLTILNITIENTYDSALYVDTTTANPEGHTGGDVSLTNVSTNGGANTSVEYSTYIDNTAGSGNVDINASSFESQWGDALKIKSNGNVSVKNSTASNSGGTGVSVESYSPSAPNLVTIQGVTARGNSGRGIYVHAVDGDIVLSDVIANENSGDGAYLSTDSTDVYSSTNAVIRSEFNDNGGTGLYLRHDASHLTCVIKVDAFRNGYYGLVAHPTLNGPDSYTFVTGDVDLYDGSTDNFPKNLYINGASPTNKMAWYFYNLDHHNKYDANPGNNWYHPVGLGYAANFAWCQGNCNYDGDDLPDADDLCPTQPGPAENNGCPVVVCGDGFEPDGVGGCAPCPAGYAGTGGTCYQCFDGKTPNANRTGCLPCPPGSWGDEGLCYDCAPGTVSGWKAKSCTPCAAGTYELDNECLPCAAGTYNDQTGQTSCQACDPGYISDAGAVECTACSPGTYELDNTCVDCDPGYVSDAAATVCMACAVGTYELDNACVDCDPGYVSDAAATECTACAAGTYELDNACLLCAAGQFNGQEGQTACQDCAAGSYSSAAGATKCSYCAPGSSTNGHEGRTACTQCRAGTFAANWGWAECNNCPAGQTSNPGAEVCFYDEPGGVAAAGLIPVTGGQLVELPCTSECVILELPDGSRAEFCGLCGYWASLTEETDETIPFDLPEGAATLKGMTVVLMDPDQVVLDEVPAGATLKLGYPLEEGILADELGMFLYDPVEEEWFELSGEKVLEYLEAFADWPGTSIFAE